MSGGEYSEQGILICENTIHLEKDTIFGVKNQETRRFAGQCGAWIICHTASLAERRITFSRY
jgi:hypothetical protein